MITRAKQRRINQYRASRNLNLPGNTVQGIRLGSRDPNRGLTIVKDAYGGIGHARHISNASYKHGAPAGGYVDDGATKWTDSLPRS